MRLTLRTLLGWKDATLAAPEYEHIGSRIVQSRLASGVVDRISSVLSTPPAPLPGERLARFTDHLNSAAAYLDNVLPSNELAGFERRCLESLQHLEEVAAVHAILADAFHDGGVVRSMPSLRRRRAMAHVRASRQPISADTPTAAANGPIPPTALQGGLLAPAPATRTPVEETRSSQEAARRLLEEFAGGRPSPKPPPSQAPAAASRWPDVKTTAPSEGFTVAVAVGPVEAKSVASTPARPQLSMNHSQWVKLLTATVALAATLSVGGSLALSLRGPQVYKPEPGCLHCTEP